MPTVLSTKCLSQTQQNLILNAGWSLVEYNAIQTQQLPNLDDFKKNHFENAIVTSQKTVAIIKTLQIDLKNVFCVGVKTASKLKEADYPVVEVTNYGKDLAELISARYADLHFNFFCGKMRNDELPDLLQKNKVDFTEHHLYQTESISKAFNRCFDAILFFSPSGVQSYYDCNSFQGERIICIGKTTALAAKKISPKIEIASKTSVESVIVKLLKTTA